MKYTLILLIGQFIEDSLIDNLSFTCYPSGHMIYVNADSRTQFRQEAEAWYSVQ